MDRIFQMFIDTLSDSPDISELRRAMGDVVAAIDLNCFAYMFAPLRVDAEVKLISNYPCAWTTHYLAEGYQRFDPVIDRAVGQSAPFQWGDDCWSQDLDASQLQLFDEAAQFGIRNGVTIPIRDPKCRIAALTFTADKRCGQFSRCVERHQSLFQLLAVLFHSRASLRLAPNRCISGIQLSPREYECLEWAARGKSGWDIGCILGISRRTAAFHLDNARLKLGVKTISQAVAKLAASANFAP
jgi:LuxR family transcriptional activator of conjugal transfer of Ti plasmids